MQRKKDIVKDALLIAKSLEVAARKNAQDVLIEAFTPRLTDVIRKTLSEEGPGPQLDGPVTKLAKGEEEETESSEVQNASTDSGYPEKITPTEGDKELKGKGKEHDLDRAAPKPGQMTEEEEEEDELDLVDEDDEIELADLDDEDEDVEEGEDHDMGKLHFDDRDAGDSSFEESDDIELDGEDELELEMDGDEEEVVTDPEDDVFEQDEDGEGEELEIPDELFDDADDQGAEDETGEPELEEEEDEELDLDVIDDEEPEMSEEDMMGDEDEFAEGLYVRREGKFMKVDPSQALEQRIKELEEERTKLATAVGALRGQVAESNLFNIKLLHLVKLYESGLFSSKEKRRIAERLDRCKSVKNVKLVYKNIVKEAQSRTVLDDIHDVITESRVRRSSKPTGETVYESDEVRKMRRLAGLDK